jgi:hypothetical protein
MKPSMILQAVDDQNVKEKLLNTPVSLYSVSGGGWLWIHGILSVIPLLSFHNAI